MLKSHVDSCKEACIKELQNSKNQRIKKLMKEVETELPKDLREEGLSSFIKDVLRSLVVYDVKDEKEEDDFIIEALQVFLSDILKMKMHYIFNIRLKGLENEINRTIKIPSIMKLADLGYMILASFRAEASHLFNFEIKEERYACDTELDFDDFEEESMLASEYTLFDLSLKKGVEFTFTYDYGDNYEFLITMQDIVVDNNFASSLRHFVIDGNGYGIWEDAHYELELFYKDKAKFDVFLKENHLDKEDYPVDSVLDVDACNEDIVENLYAIKHSYEADDDIDDLEDDMM